MVPPFDIWAGTFDIGVVYFVLACYWDVLLGVFNPQTWHNLRTSFKVHFMFHLENYTPAYKKYASAIGDKYQL